MRRFLAIMLASSFGLTAPAFAQNAPPVLIGQNSPAASPVTAGSAAQDAMAQSQDPNDDRRGGLFFFGPGGPSPLLIGGALAIAGGVVIYAATRSTSP